MLQTPVNPVCDRAAEHLLSVNVILAFAQNVLESEDIFPRLDRQDALRLPIPVLRESVLLHVSDLGRRQ